MPHSSGGGSHSGGSHSGSRSSGSSSSFSGSASSAPSVSRHPYMGATRYVYYTARNKRPHYLYFKGERKKPSLSATVIALIIVSCIALPILYALIDGAVYQPRKADVTSYSAGPLIEDNIGFMENEDVLLDAMQSFLDTTGVSPAVEIVSDDAWEGKYDSPEAFALNEYLRHFNDEKHWLFVLSYPADYADAEFVNWRWEGMIGDDLGATINSDAEDRMTALIQRALVRADGSTLAQNLAESFRAFESTAMEGEVYSFMFILAGIVLILYAAMSWYLISDYRAQYHLYHDAVRTYNGAKELNCEYCGGLYVVGTVDACPHCGAPLTARKI